MADQDNSPTLNREQSFDLSLLQETQPSLTITQVNKKNTLDDVIDADVNIINYTITGLCLAWKAPRLTIDSACKLANSTAKMLETRRKLLNMQYGHQDDKGMGKVFTPAD